MEYITIVFKYQPFPNRASSDLQPDLQNSGNPVPALDPAYPPKGGSGAD